MSRLRSGPHQITLNNTSPSAPPDIDKIPAGQSGNDALVEIPLGAPTLRKRRKLKKKRKRKESGCDAQAIKASDEIFEAILKRHKRKAMKRKDVVMKTPAGAVAMKRPAGQVLGCSKCWYLQNGCGACRPCDYKKR